MEAIPYSQAFLDCQTIRKGKTFGLTCFISFQKRIQCCCPSKKFHYVQKLNVSNDMKISNLNDMKSFAFLMTVGSISLSHIRYGIK